MEHLTIAWQKQNFEEIGSCPYCDLYIIARFDNLLYIGQSYYQSVDTRINANISNFKIDMQGLIFWTGNIDLYRSSFSRTSSDMILDAECLLIYTHQPSYNTQCKSSYTGRDNFIVKTYGCTLLRPCVRCEKGKVYYSC